MTAEAQDMMFKHIQKETKLKFSLPKLSSNSSPSEISTIRKCNNCGRIGIRLIDREDLIIKCKHCKRGELEIIADERNK